MKRVVLTLLVFCVVVNVYAQQVPDYSSVNTGTKAEQAVKADEVALQAAEYLLATPMDSNDNTIKEAASYLFRWMTMAPDYTFNIDEACEHMYGGDPALLPILLAAMVEYEMKHPDNKNNAEKVRVNATKGLIAYAQNPKNNVVMHDDLKGAAKADKKGKLAKYLATFDVEDHDDCMGHH